LSLVLDASVTLAWFLADELTEEGRRLRERIEHEGAVVPPIWFLEVANVVNVAVRRGRLTAEDADAALEALAMLRLETHGVAGLDAWRQLRPLARRHALSVYDASYVNLTLERGLPLATLDSKLRSAALAEGIRVLP
jgi:predicted nucleic acid-binding protein